MYKHTEHIIKEIDIGTNMYKHAEHIIKEIDIETQTDLKI